MQYRSCPKAITINNILSCSTWKPNPEVSIRKQPCLTCVTHHRLKWLEQVPRRKSTVRKFTQLAKPYLISDKILNYSDFISIFILGRLGGVDPGYARPSSLLTFPSWLFCPSCLLTADCSSASFYPCSSFLPSVVDLRSLFCTFFCVLIGFEFEL